MHHTFAITGATGKLGRLVIEELLKEIDPHDLIAVVRRPEAAAALAAQGVQVREGDYTRAGQLAAALQGASRVLLISGSEVGQRVAQHQAVIDAAQAAGVEWLIYTSILRCDTSPMLLANEHRATEEALRAAATPFTILRNGWYTENYTEHLAPALAHGTFLGCAGEGRIAAATRRDFARAAAAVLTGEGHEGKIYELNGDVGFTMQELAAAVSSWAGRPIGYRDLPRRDFQGALEGAGVPASFAAVLADADAAIREGWLDVVGDDLRRLIGGPTTRLEEALATVAPEAAG